MRSRTASWLPARMLYGAFAAMLFTATVSYGYDATIRWNDTRQTIRGFGGSTAWVGSKIMALTEPTRTQALNQLFDTTIGAGLSIIRGKIPGNSGDWQVMQEAKKRGVTQFWSAPWSPPSQYVSTNSTLGNPLLPEHYQAYADYLSKFVSDYKTNYNIDLLGISIQNEPHFNAPWEHCVYTGAQIRDFVKNNLGPTFARDGITAKIILPESNWNQRTWTDPTLSDAAASAYPLIVAHHYYESSGFAPYPAVKNKNLELWQSEVSNMGAEDASMSGAIEFIKQIHGLMTQAEINAWHWWWLATTGTTGEGLIDIKNGSYVTTKKLWSIANWSKFVRPGWKMMRLPSYSSSDGLIGVSAFRDTVSGKFAVVVVNSDKLNDRSIAVNFDGFGASSITPWVTDNSNDLVAKTAIACDGGTFTAALPKFSVTTYVGRGTALSAADVQVDSFSVNTAMIVPGESATLRWSTRNATVTVIDNGIGNVNASGTQVVSPTTTTTYTLTAQGPNGPSVRKLVVEVQVPRNPENPSPVTNGLNYKYYEGNWQLFPGVESLTPKLTGTLLNVAATVPGAIADYYAIQMTGFIDIPTDGFYTFYTNSDDGSQFYIGTTLVVNSDGPHGPEERAGLPISLKAGKHAVTINFLELAGGQSISVVWQCASAGITKQVVPAARWYRIGVPSAVHNPQLSSLRKVTSNPVNMFNIKGELVASAHYAKKSLSQGVFVMQSPAVGHGTKKVIQIKP